MDPRNCPRPKTEIREHTVTGKEFLSPQNITGIKKLSRYTEVRRNENVYDKRDDFTKDE